MRKGNYTYVQEQFPEIEAMLVVGKAPSLHLDFPFAV